MLISFINHELARSMEEQISLAFMSVFSWIGNYFLIWLFIPSFLLILAHSFIKSKTENSLNISISTIIILWLIIGGAGFGSCFAVVNQVSNEPSPPDGAALGCILIFFFWGIQWFLPLLVFFIISCLFALKGKREQA